MDLDKRQFEAYGVRHSHEPVSEAEKVAESLHRNGYAILPSGLDDREIESIGAKFDQIMNSYHADYGLQHLQSLDEHNTARLPMSYDFQSMFKIAHNRFLRDVLDTAFDGTYILNQQNLVLNPSRKGFNQGAWHRDLPYQHFVSSKPLAINALYCVDDFHHENGATFVLPGSHLHEEFPSENYVLSNQQQIVAPRGSFVIINGMTFHSGGFNNTDSSRRAINQVYAIPYLKQQIRIPENLDLQGLDPEIQAFLGVGNGEHESVASFLSRKDKQ